jgi:hypothetical protein
MALRWSLSEPTHFSYQIETSADGRAAVVRAVGDLDGDGVALVLERNVVLAADGTLDASAEPVESQVYGWGMSTDY